MMRLLFAAALSMAVAAPVSAQSAKPAEPAPAKAGVDYSKDSSWICLPGRGDTCARPMLTTAVEPTGYGRRSNSSPAKDPPIDCFYVYPTVSADAALNSDLDMAEELNVTAAQAARFASVCKVYVPKYRQMTLASVAAFAAGQDVTGPAILAYNDVLAAWRDYLAKRNRGRSFVLIGHSQGTLHLIQLIAREIENNPATAKRMKLAVLPGFNVMVPQGKLAGGDFKKTPLCSTPGETGCVIAWTSFREKNAPPAGAIFGVATQPGMTVACVNPARPGAAGWVSLDSYWSARPGYAIPGGPIAWSSEGEPPTPWLHVPGLNSGRCVQDGARGYFSVRTNADPKDRRTDRIGGEVGVAGLFIPGWGMHLADMSLVQGDLIRLVEQIGANRR